MQLTELFKQRLLKEVQESRESILGSLISGSVRDYETYCALRATVHTLDSVKDTITVTFEKIWKGEE